MVPVILADDGGGRDFPETGIVVGAHGDEIGAVGAEGAVPDPALVIFERGFERKGASGGDDCVGGCGIEGGGGRGRGYAVGGGLHAA